MEKQLCTYPLLEILMEKTDEYHSIRAGSILKILEGGTGPWEIHRKYSFNMRVVLYRQFPARKTFQKSVKKCSQPPDGT